MISIAVVTNILRDLAALSAALGAQENSIHYGSTLCDPAFTARASMEGGYSLEGDFCEGLYAGDVSGGIDILSVTTAPVRNSADGIVTLGAPYAQGTVQVVGSPLLASVAYRFDGTINMPTLKRWTPAKLQRTTSLQSSDMGFLGYPTGGTAGEITPICAVATPADCRQTGQVIVRIRAPVNVVALDAKIFRRSGSTWDAGTVVHLAPNGVPANVAVPVRINVSPNVNSISVQVSARQPGSAPDLRKSIFITLQ